MCGNPTSTGGSEARLVRYCVWDESQINSIKEDIIPCGIEFDMNQLPEGAWGKIETLSGEVLMEFSPTEVISVFH